MTSTFTTNKNIEKPAHNDYVDTWDVPVNADFGVIDASLGSVTSINVTSVSNYTFIYSDIQARTLKFTGTLGSGAVNYKLTNGISGDFIIDNQTIQTDATSVLTLSWTSGGTSLGVPHGTTLYVYADGGALIWRPAAQAGFLAPVTIDLTSVSTGLYSLTYAQVATNFIIFTGTCANGLVRYLTPSGYTGSMTILGQHSNAGGSSTLAIFGSGGGTGQTIASGHNYIIAIASSSTTYTVSDHT